MASADAIHTADIAPLHITLHAGRDHWGERERDVLADGMVAARDSVNRSPHRSTTLGQHDERLRSRRSWGGGMSSSTDCALWPTQGRR